MISVHELSTGDRLLKIRNPWGEELYNGKWSDSDYNWTDDLRAEVKAKQKNDGIFFMQLEDFLYYFEGTTVNFNIENWF